MTRFTGVLLPLNLLAFIFLVVQVYIANKALDANERAWVIGRVATVYVSNDKPPRIAAYISLRNYGKSPAYQVRHVIACSNGPQNRPAMGFGPAIERIVPPQTETLGSKEQPPTEPPEQAYCLNPFDVDEARRESKPVHIWLMVGYRDPFGTGRHTLQCWKEKQPGILAAKPQNGSEVMVPCGLNFDDLK